MVSLKVPGNFPDDFPETSRGFLSKPRCISVGFQPCARKKVTESKSNVGGSLYPEVLRGSPPPPSPISGGIMASHAREGDPWGHDLEIPVDVP